MSHHLKVSRRFMLGASLVALAGPALAKARETYRDPRAPISLRVADLLARMTPEEKAQQLRCLWIGKFGLFDQAGRLAPDKAAKALAQGMGQIARPGDLMGTPRFAIGKFRDPVDAASIANEIQRFLVEKTRLGIPALFHEETAHGLAGRDATIFPIPPALASTWDPDLIEQVFTVTAREARLRGVTIGLSPVLDLMREPRFGRVEEFFSEDPFLAGQMGVAAVRGLQGRVRPLARDRVFATLKHFIHGAPQGGLNIAPANLSERDLLENYVPPFRTAIRDADPAIVMPSYNEVEGIPSHANRALLQGIGRGSAGFKGIYMSDYGGIDNLRTHHHMAATDADAAVLAMSAGLGADLPDGQSFAHLPDLMRSGRVPIAAVDDAVSKVLALKFEAGLFEHPYIDPARVARGTNMPADIALARTVAEKAIVLLKNDGILPLDSRGTLRLAVIGPNAERAIFGGYSGENDKAVGILAGVRAAAGAGISVEHAEGVEIVKRHPVTFRGPTPIPVPDAENRAHIDEAVALASRSDVVLLVLGDDPDVTREATTYNGPGDRNSLDLYGQQNALVDAILATGKPVIALLLNGRPLAVNRLAEKANALLEGWYLGQQGGPAFANILFGTVNPGGKLPVSFARSVGELPVFYNRHPSADINRYVEQPRTPLFPFGYGLSYTSFAISAPSLSAAEIKVDEPFSVDVDVTNTGKRAGDEIVQLYVRDDLSSVPRPILELKAFRRVTLKPGETRKVRFALDREALAFWDVDMKYVVEPGSFTIFAGPNSATLKSTTLKVVG